MPKPQRVPPAVKVAIRKELKEPSLADLVSHFFHVAGGPKQVAKMLYEEFVAAREGSLIRQRILDMMLRATRAVNDKSGAGSDLGLLTAEDLDRELAELMCEAQDGEPE